VEFLWEMCVRAPSLASRMARVPHATPPPPLPVLTGHAPPLPVLTGQASWRLCATSCRAGSCSPPAASAGARSLRRARAVLVNKDGTVVPLAGKSPSQCDDVIAAALAA
jgi:hypothetical protein